MHIVSVCVEQIEQPEIRAARTQLINLVEVGTVSIYMLACDCLYFKTEHQVMCKKCVD